MIKLYITAVDSKENGTAVTIFEDFRIDYQDIEHLSLDERLANNLADKIEETSKINDQITSPF